MDERDRDLIARTIVGEASNQPFEGQQAVANVILNRLRSGKYGGSISDVVFAPYQFEPWMTRRGELERIDPSSGSYQTALKAIDAAGVSDPTGGATHFLEPTIVMARSGKLPAWAQGQGLRIGNHVFFNPGNDVPNRGTATESTVPFAPPQNAPNTAKNTLSPDETSLGTTLAGLAPEAPIALTPQSNSRQMPPFSDEEVDTAVFEPRTTRRGRPAVRKG